LPRPRKYANDGIEIDGKLPHGNPLDCPGPVCRQLLSLFATSRAWALVAVAATKTISANPVPEVARAQILLTCAEADPQ